MHLASLADPQLIFPDLPAVDVTSVLRGFAERIVASGRLADSQALYQALWEREQLGSTGVGSGVAVPHCKLKGLDRVLLAVGHTRQAVDFAASDGQPVRLFFVVVSPFSAPAAHLQGLAAISRWVKQSGDMSRLLEISDPQLFFQVLVGKA